jgi:hypothetical protein
MMQQRPHSPDVPASPPPEVLAEIAAAGATYDRLWEQGRRVHFELDSVTGRLSIQLLDVAGNLLGPVSPSRLLEVVSGAELR